MILSCALALVLLQQDEPPFGKTNAQILAMGRTRWYDFATKREGGESTAGMTGAMGSYGDALAWRNDRIAPKARVVRLRKLLQDTKNDAIAVGSAITGGGTMWNIISANLYADAEETLYAVLTKTGKAPARRVSDVTKALAGLSTALAATKKESWYKPEGGQYLAALRKDVAAVAAEAKKLPRRESDAMLDFAKQAVEAGDVRGIGSWEVRE